MQEQSMFYIGELIFACAILFVVLFTAWVKKQNDIKLNTFIKNSFGSIPQNNKNGIASIQSYYNYCISNLPVENAKIIDATTQKDLNYIDVYLRINNCYTSVGEEYLYNLLLQLKEEEELNKAEKLIQTFNDDDFRAQVSRILLKTGKSNNNGLAFMLFNAKTSKLKYAFLYKILAILPIVLFVVSAFLGWGAVLFGVLICIANTFIYNALMYKVESNLESLQYFYSVLYGIKKLAKLPKINELFTNIKSICIKFKYLGGFISGKARSGFGEFEALTMLIKMFFLIDLIKYNHTIKVIEKNIADFRQIYKVMGEIDSAISVLSFRKSLKFYCSPTFTEDLKLEFSEIYHPLIKNPVTNSGSFDKGCIITGSNASGKSTFIKAMAINIILGQTINTCCAKSFCMPRSYIATSMALRDDVISGDSYYVAEIKSLKRLINHCKSSRCICFIDEILKGTNTKERIGASIAVLKSLAKNLVFVATHDTRLATVLGDIYRNIHFCEEIGEGEITFDYKLKEGICTSTNAILLLKHMGFEESIVTEASRLVEVEEGY